MTNKISVKDKCNDGEIDLSMCDLNDVPVKKIVQQKKVYSLDLSNNRIITLPKNFCILTQLTKLDLSKNEVKSLPEDFGNLSKLKYLDLYSNQIQRLPLSVSKLKDLKWLDLKDNPLVPRVAKIAGECLDTKQCQSCARDIVNFYVKLERQVNAELEMRNKTRQKQLEINQQKKQVEKKEKKKEKLKQKREVEVVQQINNHKAKPKKENNKVKNETVSKKHTKSYAFTLLFVLFVLTSIKCKYTENIEFAVKDAYKIGLEKLPLNFKTYGIQLGNIFQNLHENTGNVTLIIVRTVYESIPKSKRDQIIHHLMDIWEILCTKVNEIYTNISAN